MVFAIALLTASVTLVAKLSIALSVVIVYLSGNWGGEGYSTILACSPFQSVLAKWYGGCVGVDTREVRSRIVSIGRWSEPWSFSVPMWHFMTLFIARSFPHTKSIAVFLDGNVIVPGGIISCIAC